MTRSIQATAPGKLILLGEYAVLFGAPAVVLAVERRARVELQPSADSLWHVVAPGLAPGDAPFRVEAGGTMRWDNPDDARRLGLLELLFSGLAAMGILEPSGLPPLRLHLDTREFFQEDMPGRPKLGLGSSAALTVATATALAAWDGPDRVPEPGGTWLTELVELHRRIQGGMGSGIDVAASLLGGTHRYRLAGDPPRPEALPLEPPAGIGLRFVWTGRPASTGDFLGRLHSALDRDPGPTRACLKDLHTLSQRAVDAVTRHDHAAVLASVEGFWEALDRLGRCIHVPILSPGHVRLHRLAREHGVAYKPSGAGGGDFGIAFGESPTALDAFTRHAKTAGYHPVHLNPAREGVTVSAADNEPSPEA